MVKYIEIYEEIRRRITESEYKANQKLPDGTTLAKEFGCSELTIKKALDILVTNGLVTRKRGAGSFVKQTLGSTNFKHLYGAKYVADYEGVPIKTSVITFEIESASEKIADKLNCDVGDTVYHIIRVRKIGDASPKLEDCYMPVVLIPGLKLAHLEDSIYSYITNELKLKIHSSTLEISIINPSDIEVEHLGVSPDDFIVNVEQLAYLDNGEIFEYSNVKNLRHDFCFSTNIIKI